MPPIANSASARPGFHPRTVAIPARPPTTWGLPFHVLRCAAASGPLRKPPSLVAVEYGITVVCFGVAAYLSFGH
jgi:hypothetical protein